MMRFLLASMLLVLAACAAPPAQVDSLTRPAERLIWPQPPQQARIEFVEVIASGTDLGLRDSLGRRFRDWLAGSENRLMQRPYAIAATGDLILVADPGLSAVHVFDNAGKKYDLIKSAGGTPLQSPVGVAVSPRHLFIADSRLNTVFILDLEGRLVRRLTDFGRPTSLAFDIDSGNLYVADTTGNEVRVFGEDGTARFSIGNRGEKDGEFNYPSHLSFKQGILLVNDTMNFRIQRFNAEGQHQATLGKHGGNSGFLAQPKGVAMDSDGHVYVADAVTNRVQIFGMDGQFLLEFGVPGHGFGEFSMPAGVAILGDMIYVADSRNRRIQVFRYLAEDP